MNTFPLVLSALFLSLGTVFFVLGLVLRYVFKEHVPVPSCFAIATLAWLMASVFILADVLFLPLLQRVTS